MNKSILILFLFSMLIANPSCKKEKGDGLPTIERLYIQYKNGSISECTLAGDKVYVAGINARDASAFIYSEQGLELGQCGGWTGSDSICAELQSCEIVYDDGGRNGVKVDKYGLAN